MWEVKSQELSKISEEFENNKHNVEKWQAELSDKDYDLVQKLNGLQIREQELVQREQDLELKGQRLWSNIEIWKISKTKQLHLMTVTWSWRALEKH